MTYKDNYSLPLIEDCLDSHHVHWICVADTTRYQWRLVGNIKRPSTCGLVLINGTGFPWVSVRQGPRFLELCDNATWVELGGVSVYLDDIIVHGTDFTGTLSALRKVSSDFISII